MLVEELLQLAKHGRSTESIYSETLCFRFKGKTLSIILEERHNVVRKLIPGMCDPKCRAGPFSQTVGAGLVNHEGTPCTERLDTLDLQSGSGHLSVDDDM